jgi:urocanate hydratase
MAAHVEAMLGFQRWAAPRSSTTATTSARRLRRRRTNAFDFPGFVPAYIRPLFCEGNRPVPLGALSGDPEDIYATDARPRRSCSPTTSRCTAGSTWPRERIAFQGLPARICWLGYGERAKAGLAFNEMVRRRRAEGADRHRPRPPRLRLGRLPNRETEAMKDGSDADRRLAAAQRAAQHRRRRDLGLDPPRRRRRHRLLAARRHGHRRRRHRRTTPVIRHMGVIRHADAGYTRASRPQIAEPGRSPTFGPAALHARRPARWPSARGRS